MGVPNSWMVFVRENPNLKWMVTGGTPMAMATPKLLLAHNFFAFFPFHMPRVDDIKGVSAAACGSSHSAFVSGGRCLVAYFFSGG